MQKQEGERTNYQEYQYKYTKINSPLGSFDQLCVGLIDIAVGLQY